MADSCRSGGGLTQSTVLITLGQALGAVLSTHCLIYPHTYLVTQGLLTPLLYRSGNLLQGPQGLPQPWSEVVRLWIHMLSS